MSGGRDEREARAGSSWPRLGRDALPAIVGLVQRSIVDPPSEDELDRCLFAPDQPATVLGDPAIGVVATVRAVGEPTSGFVRLLAVDPRVRRRGHGRSLLAAGESTLDGARTVTVGADAPYFLFPGVPAEATALHCLLESERYARVDTHFDMEIDLEALPPDPGGTALATGADLDDVVAMVDADYPHWTLEVRRALERDRLVIDRDLDGRVAAFCAFEVNRAGTLGPVAARLDLVGSGAGRPVLLGALHRLRATGARSVQVLWVGPIRPYAAVGGTVSRVWFVHTKKLSSRKPRPHREESP